MQKLAKPPLNLVTLKIEFPHNLKISEKRSEYYDAIKNEFPAIVFPENKGLAYNYSDCHFRDSGSTTQIRIATNYFVLETAKYENKDAFWNLFERHFSEFTKRFAISNVVSFLLSYDNLISIKKGIAGEDFSDYLSLGLFFKNKEQRKFITVDGVFVFAVEGGFMAINIRPRQNKETLVWDALNFKLDFQINKNLPISEKLNDVKRIFDLGHGHIEDLFVSSLAEKYFEEIN